MKNYLSILFIFISLSLQAQEAVEDFRGLKWGTLFEEVSFDDTRETNLIYRGGNGEIGKYYVRKDEDLTIGTVLLEDIYYVFDGQNRFYKVVINGKASANEDMEYVLQKRFGKADKRYRRSPKFIRRWEINDVNIIFSEQRSKDFVLQIESKADVKTYVDINSNITDF